MSLQAFRLIKWKFRIVLGALILASLALWAFFHVELYPVIQESRDPVTAIELTRLLKILHLNFASLVLALVIAAVFVFRPLVLGLGQRLESLRGFEARSRSLVENAADGIITFDQNGIIESVNPAAESMFAFKSEQVIGNSIQQIMPGYRGTLEVDANEKEIRGIDRERIGHRWDGSTFHMELTVSEIQLPESKLHMAIIRDVSARKSAERNLIESEERFRLLVELSPEAIAIHSEGKLIFLNGAGLKLLGATRPEDIIGKPILDFVPHHLRKTVVERIQKMNTVQTNVPLLEEQFLRVDGRTVDVEVAAIPFTHQGKQAIQVVARDITSRRQADAQIRKSLKEKEILIKEIQHRVKNNLQVIASLLDLQSDFVIDAKARDIIRECLNRVRSISMIHEQLYQSQGQDLAKIDFPDYIRVLADNLFRSYGAEQDRVALKIEVTEIHLGVDTAIPCGLIIHELVSNSLKHAFPDERSGEIRVGLHSDGDRYILVVSDNGIGFPPGADFRSIASLGLQLVDTLTSQITGHIDFHSNRGTEYIISFRPQ